MNATIVSATKDSVNAYVSASVVEADGKTVEYSISTPLNDDKGVAFSPAVLKANAIAALKAQRDAQVKSAPSVVAGLTGTVTV